MKTKIPLKTGEEIRHIPPGENGGWSLEKLSDVCEQTVREGIKNPHFYNLTHGIPHNLHITASYRSALKKGLDELSAWLEDALAECRVLANDLYLLRRDSNGVVPDGEQDFYYRVGVVRLREEALRKFLPKLKKSILRTSKTTAEQALLAALRMMSLKQPEEWPRSPGAKPARAKGDPKAMWDYVREAYRAMPGATVHQIYLHANKEFGQIYPKEKEQFLMEGYVAQNFKKKVRDHRS
jgi:hypothetical protein